MSPDSQSLSSRPGKSQRVLSCVLCQQRKVKCDRRFPCANCIKSKAQCVPATLTERRRKRRFPERELLDRLRTYEDLLRQNNINFDTVRKDAKQDSDPAGQGRAEQSDEDGTEDIRTGSTASLQDQKGEKSYKARNFWHSVTRSFRENENDSDSSNDDVRESTVKRAWEEIHDNGNHLLFGIRGLYVDLSLSHPNPVQILRLWQTYLDNVDALLKVTHTPTLQGRVIAAASDLTKITPTFEALLFGIYCVSVLSMSEQDCQSVLGSSKEDSLTRFQIACQQALANCGFLNSDNRDCLTALLLYLITIRYNTVPPIVCSLFGVAIRLAQRMGIHSEYALSKCTIFEAEMRRRLWWALVLFDSRIGELSNIKPVTLDPTWDCKMPLNINDADLRPELKKRPSANQSPTEALFSVLRSEVGEFVRFSYFHLELNSPGLRSLAKPMEGTSDADAGEAAKIETQLDEKYFQYCDEENSIHYMTVWSTKSALAKCKLLEHHARYSNSSTRQTDMLRDTATLHAIHLLRCDSKIMHPSFVAGFKWLNHFHFPFPAYIHIIQDLKRRPLSEVATQAWEAMSENFEPWLGPQFGMNTPFFTIFTKMVLEAWEICEAAQAVAENGAIITPRIVTSIREVLAQATQQTDDNNMDQGQMDINMITDDLLLHTMPQPTYQNFWFDMGTPPNWPPGVFSGAPGQALGSTLPNWPGSGGQLNWTSPS